jgi:hypothetical protein
MPYQDETSRAWDKLRQAEEALETYRSGAEHDFRRYEQLFQDVRAAQDELIDIAGSLWPET